MKNVFKISLLFSFIALHLHAHEEQRITKQTVEEAILGSEGFADTMKDNKVFGYQLTRGADNPHSGISVKLLPDGKLTFAAIALSAEYLQHLRATVPPHATPTPDTENDGELTIKGRSDIQTFNHSFAGRQQVTYQYPSGRNKHNIASLTVLFSRSSNHFPCLIGTVNHSTNSIAGLSSHARTAVLKSGPDIGSNLTEFIAVGAHELSIRFNEK